MSEKPVGVQRRLAVAGKFEVRHQIDQYSGMTVGARSKNEMMEEVIKQSARQLEDFACAACMRCKNMEPKVEQYEDPVRMVTQVQMTLTCKPGQSHCPDGFDLEKRAFVSSSPDADLPYGDEWNTEEGFVARVMNHDTLPERVKKWHELQAEQMKAGTMTMTIATGGPVREIVMADEKSGEPVKLHRSGETELLYPEDMSRFIRHLPKDRWAMGGTSKMSTEDFNREYLTTFKNADGTTAPSFKENGNTVYVPVGKPDVPQTLDDSVW